MTKEEYEYLQNNLSRKMKETGHIKSPTMVKGYKEGLLVAKSLVHTLKPKEKGVDKYV